MTKETQKLMKAYVKAGWVEVNAKSGGHIKLKPPTGTPTPTGQLPFVSLSCSPSDQNAYKAQLREAKKWGIEP